MKHHTFFSLAALGVGTVLLGCTTSSNSRSTSSSTTVAATSTSASAGAAQGEWRSLIDPTMSAWRGYKEQAMPAEWKVQDGVLSKVKSTNDIVTRDQFANFELEWEWKIHEGGNAGMFYRGSEEFEKIYFTAPEYQLLDDANAPDGKNRLTSAAANYALYAAPAGVVKAADQWNSSRIVARGARVEHWLNGQKVVEYEVGSPDWEAKVKASKFAEWPKYGRLTSGHIGIQGDHDGELAIRNMRIRPLP
ncbi:MAG TPA: DUF1080 domain-containing protein [Gemmatimonadaceae bacterium]|nr:DUF1080 domain-containing protein [Gemmatimonadaceae bacterium]